MPAFTIVDGQVVPIDADGNPILSVQDGTYYRLAVEASIKPGSTIGTIPAASPVESAFFERLRDTGGSANMAIDGSTPVVFQVTADPDYDIELTELRLVLVSGTLNWGAFGKSGILPNGVLVEARLDDSGTTVELTNIVRNEDFLHFQNPQTHLQLVGDAINASFGLSGQTIVHGSSDFVRITIRDDLTGSYDIDYFEATLYGATVEPE